MASDQVQDQFARIREEMRRLRGENRFRGREEYLLPKGCIRIYMEDRGDAIRPGFFEIRVAHNESDTSVVQFPEGKTFLLKDFRFDLRAFLEFITNEARGADYLRTHSQHADYRNPTREEKR